ncbi:hypothetical protein SK128_021762 [Halocaridina rubra]|uniref:Uncharacterized protein n=1 Tax=Halocaridina rubra TaxID=373956 RepID=A0AAN8XAG9_HALRR
MKKRKVVLNRTKKKDETSRYSSRNMKASGSQGMEINKKICKGDKIQGTRNRVKKRKFFHYEYRIEREILDMKFNGESCTVTASLLSMTPTNMISVRIVK